MTSPAPAGHVPATPNAWLRVLRVGVAGAVLWQTAEQWLHPSWRAVFVDPPLRVPMPGLAWAQVHGAWAIGSLFAWTCVSAGLTLIGRGGRWAPLAMAVGMLGLFAQDASLYLNHHYLLIVLSLTVALMPPLAPRDPGPRDALWFARFTLVVPYVYAAIAKFDPDWLTGRVMARMLLARDATFGAWVNLPGQVIWMTYGAIALDAFAPLLLWWGVAVWPAWAALCAFHLANSGLYDIGVFPWLMLTITPILLPADTLPRMAATLSGGTRAQRLAMLLPAFVFAAVSLGWTRNPHPIKTLVALWAGAVLGWLWIRRRAPTIAPVTGAIRRALPRTFVVAWAAAHLVVPFRHLAIPGDVTWTEQGHRYAWRMLLRTKRVDEALVEISDPRTGERWFMRPNELLQPFQATDILARPDLAWTFARTVQQHFERAGRPGVAVRLHVQVSLNGRDPVAIYDPTVDLTTAPLPTWTAIPWVRPTPRTMWW